MLSLTALAVAAERFARHAGPTSRTDLARWLVNELHIDHGRAALAIEYAVQTGRLRVSDRGFTSGRTSL
jgi:hypothetical protein